MSWLDRKQSFGNSFNTTGIENRRNDNGNYNNGNFRSGGVTEFDRKRNDLNFGQDQGNYRNNTTTDTVYGSTNNGFKRNTGLNNFDRERDSFGGGVFSSMDRSDLRNDRHFETSNLNYRNGGSSDFKRENDDFSGMLNVSRSDTRPNTDYGNVGRSFASNNDLFERRNFSDNGNSNYSNSIRDILSTALPAAVVQLAQNMNNGRNQSFRNQRSAPYPSFNRRERTNMDSRPQRESRQRRPDRRPIERKPQGKSNEVITKVIEVIPRKVVFVEIRKNQGDIKTNLEVNISFDKKIRNQNGTVPIKLTVPKNKANAKAMLNKASKQILDLAAKLDRQAEVKSNQNGKQNERKLPPREPKVIKLDESNNIKINLNVAIADDSIIDEEKATKIKAYLSKKIDEALENGTVVRFRTMNLYIGELRVICADENSLEWLRKTVTEVPELWENSKLRFIHNDTKFPNRIKVFIPGPEQSNEMILKKLAGQNPNISVEKWEIYQTDRKGEDKTLLYIGADVSSLEALIKAYMRMYFEFNTVEFTLIRRYDFNIENPKMDII